MPRAERTVVDLQGQRLKLKPGPVIFYRYVLSLDITGFVQSLAERVHNRFIRNIRYGEKLGFPTLEANRKFR
jgi:hypothetical protein